MSSPRMPAVFLPHGGGPWPFMDLSAFGPPGMYDGLAAWLRGLSGRWPAAPRAVLVVSAHWEAPMPTVMTGAAPPLHYDYYGFPPETYRLRWPAPGAPEMAEATRERLEAAGFPTAADAERGFDHGTFVPLMLTWPAPTLPTFQLSLREGLDPAEHLAIGRALAPLRDEGVLILGSGMSYHNMGGFFGRVPTATEDSRIFDDWLAETVTAPADAREARLADWARAPRARACHPREEHLLPLMVVAGAAGDDAGSTPWRGVLMGTHVSAASFG